MKLSKIKSIVLADYILARVEKVDHLKLQKLIYYCEAWHLAIFDNQSLVSDDFEAWVHGPVSRKIWIEFKGQSILYSDLKPRQPLAVIKKLLQSLINTSQFDLVNEVLDTYGKYSSFKLEEFTHSEKPWKQARRGYAINQPSSELIDKKIMGSYYRERL